MVNEDSYLLSGLDHGPSTLDFFRSSPGGIHHNLQGLESKLPEISQWLHVSDVPTILCCSETWLQDVNPSMSIAGYKTFCSPSLRRNTVSNSTLPGSCIFVSTALQLEQTVLCKDVAATCSVLNVTCCFVQCKYHRIAIVSLYRSPSTCPTTALNDLNNVILALADYAEHFIIAGDLNINLLADSAIKAQYVP